jgi:hypothetical protein
MGGNDKLINRTCCIQHRTQYPQMAIFSLLEPLVCVDQLRAEVERKGEI